jgi:hypothetical protein
MAIGITYGVRKNLQKYLRSTWVSRTPEV